MTIHSAVALTGDPVRIDTATQPNLADGLRYALQNQGVEGQPADTRIRQRIRLAESAAKPDPDTETGQFHIVGEGASLSVTLDTAQPIWAWVDSRDGEQATLGIGSIG